MTRWTLQAVEKAAPDAASLAAGRRLAVAGPWSETGSTETLVWGRCQGSGRTPYHVSVDLSGPAYRCSCPSRKFPCKHTIALLLMWVREDAAFGTGEMSDFAREWAEQRASRAAGQVAAEARAARAAAGPKDPAAAAKRREERLALMNGGIADFSLWLTDLVRAGLVSARRQPLSWWDVTAARLVDAQLPGLAQDVGDVGGAVNHRADWSEHLLAAVGRWWTTIMAWEARDTLDDRTSADLRVYLGWAHSKDDVRAGDSIEDRWLVLGAYRTDNGRVQEQRTWLRGETTGELVQLLEFAARQQPLPVAQLTGSVLESTLSRYPGSHPRRALFATEPIAEPRPVAWLPPGTDLDGALEELAGVWARNPWANRTPVVLDRVTLVPMTKTVAAHVVDRSGASLPLLLDGPEWPLFARAGGRPGSVFGELEAGGFRPLTLDSDLQVAEERRSPVSRPSENASSLGHGPSTPSPGLETVARATSSAAGIDQEWWTELSTAALVGTGRRTPPPAPAWDVVARPGAPKEVEVLDAAALGGMLRRAGRRPVAADVPEPAADETLPVAASRAHQILDLLLTQPPVGQLLAPSLTAVWLATARRLGRRVRHARVPDVLALAHANPALRTDAQVVVGERGAWLAGFEPTWSWVLAAGAETPADRDDWAVMPAGDRLRDLAAVRRRDPGAGRALVESVWRTAPAPERAQLVQGLGVGLTEADSDFLEVCLDDRARGVREAAWVLLDALPGSERAARMGERLRPLISVKGASRLVPRASASRTIEVELPPLADAAAARDGLVTGPRGRSERGFWLERIASGARLSVWTEGGLTPDQVVRGLSDLDVLVGIRAATLARGDQEWARALLVRAWDAALLALVPPEEREASAIEHLTRVRDASEAGRIIAAVPTPWGEDWSRAVVRRLAGDTVLSDVMIIRGGPQVVHALATGLHPATLGEVQRWAAGRGPGDRVSQIAQYLSLATSLEEAFT